MKSRRLTRKIIRCWGADAFIVVLGAPIGSLVLTPEATKLLRRLFYVMATVQFVNFNFMEEAFYDARVAPFVGTRLWYVLGPLLALEVGVLALHFCFRVRARKEVRGSLV